MTDQEVNYLRIIRLQMFWQMKQAVTRSRKKTFRVLKLIKFLTLSFVNIPGLCSNFVECESFLESNSNIFALCETNLNDSLDFNFSVRGCLRLIWMDSVNHMHSLAVYVKEVLSFAWDLPLKMWIVVYVSDWIYFIQCYIFPLCWSPSYLSTIFYGILLNMGEVLLINPSANVFVFWDFNIHHKELLTYSGGNDRPSKLCYILSN